MNSFFLTNEEVEELTGYARRKEQCGHLRREGVKFLTDRSGWPKVTRQAVFEACGFKGRVSDSETVMPDLEALKRITDGT